MVKKSDAIGANNTFAKIGKLITQGLAEQLAIQGKVAASRSGKPLKTSEVLNASRALRATDAYQESHWAARGAAPVRAKASRPAPAPPSQRSSRDDLPRQVSGPVSGNDSRASATEVDRPEESPQSYRRERKEVKNIIRFDQIADAVMELAPPGERVRYAKSIETIASMGHPRDFSINAGVIAMLKWWQNDPPATRHHANTVARRILDATGEKIYVVDVLRGKESRWDLRADRYENPDRYPE